MNYAIFRMKNKLRIIPMKFIILKIWSFYVAQLFPDAMTYLLKTFEMS
jgi:hypothetical protein